MISSALTSVIGLSLRIFIPCLVMYFSALSACFLSNMLRIVPAASTTKSETSSSFTLYSRASVDFHSKSSPAISIPVKPEPATTKVSISFLFTASLSKEAALNLYSICSRILSASSNDQRLNPFSLTPGTPKYAGSLPIPIIK